MALHRPAPVARFIAFALAAMALLVSALTAPAVARQDGIDDLVGIYSVSIAKPDLPANLPGRAALLGTWTITFAADGTFIVARQDVGPVTSGEYTVSGSTLTIDDWNGLIGCGAPVAENPGATYAWRPAGDGIALTVIEDPCTDRRLLFATHPLTGFEACSVAPLGASSMPLAAASPVPLATPVSASRGVGAQEGLPQGESSEAAIDSLLRQATGCWASGDPARFLALHSQKALSDIGLIAPLADFARDLRLFMSTPISFTRIGDITVTGPDTAWAYVEISLGGDRIPQRLDFVREDGVWLFDAFFLFGPTPPTTDTTVPAP
jgi:hypothetical protein